MSKMSYRDQVTGVLNKYKRKSPEDYLVMVPVTDASNTVVGFLHPVTADYRSSIPNCVDLFSRWREENPTLSLARFQITHQRTEFWLDHSVILNDNRIIFLIEDCQREYIGHIGFANFRYEQRIAEVDSVLRGRKKIHPRIMEYAISALVRWGKRELGLRQIDLEVYSENAHAINFYKRCGFSADVLIPLEKEILPDEVRWNPCADNTKPAEKYYLRMILHEEVNSRGENISKTQPL